MASDWSGANPGDPDYIPPKKRSKSPRLTLRDQFAMTALACMIPRTTLIDSSIGLTCYEIADSMLSARKQQKIVRR